VDLAILHYAQAQQKSYQTYQLVSVVDPNLLLSRAQQLRIDIQLKELAIDTPTATLTNNELGFIAPKHHASPHLDKANARYILETLDIAIDACQKKFCHGMVTGPIQKSIINDAGIPFSGHTEYLAQQTQTQQVVMMLATEGLRVALATTHLPLKDVANAITQDSLCEIVRILNHDLKTKFGIPEPTILVCGLNPHAGESGHLGREEIDTIIPALAQLTSENILCQGPLPADTLFTPKYLAQADAVLAMYHDQGLPVLKYKGFGAAANITLGLPIIRTSVDHGTAIDLAGTGNIDPGSLSTAIDYALAMTNSSGIQ
jgi:4-hydroxythreonine-4-phosphate dehydrogenase